MSFSDAIRMSMANYSNFSGRSRRSEYWYFHLFVALAYTAVIVVCMSRPALGGLLALVGVVALVVPSVAVNVRRLHDIDHSGWWIWIGVVPLIGPILLLIWHCTPGTVGSNRFGGDPKAA